MKNPHNLLVAIDPPRADPPRRWRCHWCHMEGLFDDLQAVACTFVYPPCDYCGQAPTCARDCPGVAAALAGDDVYIAGLGPPQGDA